MKNNVVKKALQTAISVYGGKIDKVVYDLYRYHVTLVYNSNVYHVIGDVNRMEGSVYSNDTVITGKDREVLAMSDIIIAYFATEYVA